MIDLYSSYRVYFVAATLGAHSNLSTDGFRQKDVRFLLGLFLNWMDSTIKNVDEKIHNTQISRYLDTLLKAGYISKQGRERLPRYRLTRAGLLELVGQLVQVPVHAPLEQFFFMIYFMKTYRARLTELVTAKENRLPRSLQIELESRLDIKELLDQQTRHIKLEISKLEARLQDTKGAAALANQLSKKGAKNEEIIKAVEQLYPYELNSQKSMSDLFREIPASMRSWELNVGNENRANILWTGLRDYLRAYLQILEKMNVIE